MFTNGYVALCGAALASATYVLLGQTPRVDAVVGLVFCCTLVIYNLDRLVEPHPGDTAHERWIDQHRKSLWAITLVAGLGILCLLPMLSRPTLGSLLPAGAIAVGYCVPVLRWRGRWRRLKALPGAKLILIALVWTYATAGLALLETGLPFSYEIGLVLIARFLFIAAVALPFDLPDMQRDRLSEIATLPTLLGVQATRQIAIGLAIGAGLLGVYHPWPAGVAVCISSLATLALVSAMRPDRGVIYFMVALDGMLLVQALLLMLFA